MTASKPHPATRSKRLKARKEGKILKSPLLTQALAGGISLLFLALFLRSTWVQKKILLQYTLTIGVEQPLTCLRWWWDHFLLITLGFLGCSAFLSVLVDLAQFGFLWQPSIAAFKLERICPVKGIKRLLSSLRQSWEYYLRLLSFTLVGCCYFLWLWKKLLAGHSYLQELLRFSFQAVNVLMISGCFTLLLLGGIEYLVRRVRYEKELAMSEQEFRRENKEEHGDPQIKALLRSRREEILMNDLISRIRKAKVIIVQKESA